MRVLAGVSGRPHPTRPRCMTSTPRRLSLVPSAVVEPQHHTKPSMPSWLVELCRALEQQLPALFPPVELGGLAGEVARLLGPVREVAVARLANEDKVVIEGARLTVAEEYPLGLEGMSDASEQLRSFALYVAHEVAHIAQGVSDKARVGELHAVDGEDSLLWIDHEADHAAARYCAAVLKADLLALRRLQLRALGSFPVAMEHRPSDRRRKVRRVVDLATDVAAREQGLIVEAEIASLRWTRGGGPALVMVQGRFRRVLLRTKIAAGDAGKLEAAANEDPRGTRRAGVLGVVGKAIGRGILAPCPLSSP